MSEHSVRQHLDVDLDAYDQTIRRWIPGYEQMLDTAARAVAEAGATRVLDLGGGTGALSAAVLDHCPNAIVELIDIDPEMLEQAKGRLRDRMDRIELVHASFQEALSAPVPDRRSSRCDAIVASLALHHIPTIEAKSALFEQAFAALGPGGVLVNGDCTMPAETDDVQRAERERLYRYWADFQVSQGIREEDAWGHFEAWSEEDTYLPLEQELAALTAAGFHAERVWNDGPIGVVVARKPEAAISSRVE